MVKAQVEVFRSTQDRQWYWRVRAANHRILAASEGYRTKRSAVKGAKALGRALGLPDMPVREL